MTEEISATAFLEADGVEDWRVISDGAVAFFPNDSFAASARFVQAISELDSSDPPDVDIRSGGVTVRLITAADGYYGMAQRDIERARGISEVARQQGLSADPSAVQSVLVIVGSLSNPEVMPFWQAVTGILGRDPTARTRTSSIRHDRGPGLCGSRTVDVSADRPQLRDALRGVRVPLEQAEARVAGAAIAAGGTWSCDDRWGARLWAKCSADPEGNEADIATLQGRDEAFPDTP